MQIQNGIIQGPSKVVIYGVESVGKTVLGSLFPKPLFIDTEESTRNLAVSRITPTCWAQIMGSVDELIKDNQGFETLVIDSMDWTEKFAIQKICDSNPSDKITGIEDFGYGKGYVYLQEEIAKFLNKLTILRNTGMHIVLTSHATIKKFEQPDEAGAYDRYELKLEKKTAPLVREWCDMLLFANFKTYVVEDQNKKLKAQDGGRVLYTCHSPAFDAKNRSGFPKELKMDLEKLPAELAKVINYTKTKAVAKPAAKPVVEKAKVEEVKKPEVEKEKVVEKLVENEEIEAASYEAYENSTAFHSQLYSLMEESGVTAAEIQKMVIMRGHFPESMPIDNYPVDYVNGRLIANWDKVVNFINKKVRV